MDGSNGVETKVVESSFKDKEDRGVWKTLCRSISVISSNGHSGIAAARMKQRSVTLGGLRVERVPEDNEETLLDRMRASVIELDPLSKDIDDATLKRFLQARSWKVDKASNMCVAHQRWRRSYVPLGYIPEEQVMSELQCQKLFMAGRDKKGRPVPVAIGAKHDSYGRDLEEFKRFTVHVFDKIIASMPLGEEKFTIIMDLQGVGYRNLDPRGMSTVFESLQAYYPERLGTAFLVHIPLVFWGIWRMMSPFIDNATKEKMVFVEDKVLQATLLGAIDNEQLPEIYGGKGALVPFEDFSIPNWPPKSAAVDSVLKETSK